MTIRSSTQPYYFHCLSSACTAETVAVKLGLWNSSKQMLEVIDFFSQKHFERLSKIVTQKGISCGRKGLCVFAPDCVCVCVFLVCVCVWSGCLGVLIYRCGSVPGRNSQATLISRPKLSSAAARCPAFTPDTTLLIRLSKSRASLSFSFQPLRPNKRPTMLKTNTLLNLIWIYLFAYGYLGGHEMYPNWLTFHLNQDNEMGWCGVVVKAPGVVIGRLQVRSLHSCPKKLLQFDSISLTGEISPPLHYINEHVQWQVTEITVLEGMCSSREKGVVSTSAGETSFASQTTSLSS